MVNKTIRLLRADEIECRVSSISKNGVSLLLYKDARVDQRILDETFGIFGWKRSHQCIDGNLYCTVEVFDKETGIWVSKQDAGSTGKSEKEKEKSQASDSFKRACFNWGIGRELYTAPFIWIPVCRGYKKANSKDFMLLLYAETELDYLLVIDITNDDTPPLYFQGNSDNNYTAKILYDQFKYAIEKEINI